MLTWQRSASWCLPSFILSFKGSPTKVAEQDLSLEISIILMTTYILSLVFTLRTHKHLYAEAMGRTRMRPSERKAGRLVSQLLVLLIATAFVALMSEFLVAR